MAALLVRLKLRLLVNRLAQGFQVVLGLLLGLWVGALAAIVGFGLLSTTLARDGDTEVVTLALALTFVGWIVLPALTFSSDETLDPRRFQLLPISHRRLVGGLAVAGLVGIGPIATAVGLSGAAVGTGRVAGSWLVGAVGLVVVLLLVVACVVWSRAVVTLLSDVLATRRGREIGAALTAVVAVSLWVGSQALLGGGLISVDGDVDLAAAAAVARWSPGGLADVGLRGAADGRVGAVIGAVLGLAAVIGLGLLTWAGALRRLDRRAPAQTSSRGASALYPTALAWLPRTPTTAVAVRFLRSLVRDPRVRSQALGQLFLLIPLVAVGSGAGVLTGPSAPVAVAGLAFPLGLVVGNQLAMDGPALWTHEVAGTDPRADILGRDLAVVLVALPALVMGALALAVVADAWAALAPGLLVGIAVLVLVLGAANLSSVLLPVPVPERGDNLFGTSGGGQGCLNSFFVLLVYMVVAVLVLPIVVPVALLDGPVVRTVAATLGLLYGGGIAWAATRMAVQRLRLRGPELLLAVDWRRS